MYWSPRLGVSICFYLQISLFSFPNLFGTWASLLVSFAFVFSGRIIDNKTLRLITESSDYSPSKDDKLDNNLRGNVTFSLLLFPIMFVLVLLKWLSTTTLHFCITRTNPWIGLSVISSPPSSYFSPLFNTILLFIKLKWKHLEMTIFFSHVCVYNKWTSLWELRFYLSKCLKGCNSQHIGLLKCRFVFGQKISCSFFLRYKI